MKQDHVTHWLPDKETRKLIRQIGRGLGSDKPERQTESFRLLRLMGPEAVEVIRVLLQREARSRKLFRVALFLALAWFIYQLGKSLPGHRSTHKNMMDDLTVALQLFMGFFGCFFASRLQKSAADALVEFQDVRTIGPFLELRAFSEMRLKGDEALLRLLPLLQSSDAPLFDRKCRECMNRALLNGEAPLVIEILKALVKIGDSSALPYVERIAARDVLAGNDPRVQSAAQECLPLLKARIERESLAQTLLRPASAPGDPAETLVRPAHDMGETDARLLLRPSAPDE